MAEGNAKVQDAIKNARSEAAKGAVKGSVTGPTGAAKGAATGAAKGATSRPKSERSHKLPGGKVPESEQALREKAQAKKRQQQKDTLKGLAFTSAKRFSERHYRRVLIAEFVIATATVILGEMMADDFVDTPHLKSLVAVFVAFFVLAAGTTMGTGPSRLSAAMGGLVTLVIVMKFVRDTTYRDSNGQMKNKITDFFGGKWTGTPQDYSDNWLAWEGK